MIIIIIILIIIIIIIIIIIDEDFPKVSNLPIFFSLCVNCYIVYMFEVVILTSSFFTKLCRNIETLLENIFFLSADNMLNHCLP